MRARPATMASVCSTWGPWRVKVAGAAWTAARLPRWCWIEAGSDSMAETRPRRNDGNEKTGSDAGWVGDVGHSSTTALGGGGEGEGEGGRTDEALPITGMKGDDEGVATAEGGYERLTLVAGVLRVVDAVDPYEDEGERRTGRCRLSGWSGAIPGDTSS